ncbi:MAG: nitroreductase family protein [Acidobacteriota bacterium]|jgi:nitroreductase
MEKPAPTRYPIHELIADRWSPRAFSERPVEEGMLHRLFEAARWAPSSRNEQPWSFIVCPKQNEEAHGALLRCLSESNQEWAQHAPILMMSVAKLALDHNGKPNRHAYHDVGQAVAMMLVEATDLELVAHQMGGFDQDKARELLQIPEGFDPVAAIALGYPGDAENLSLALQKREYAPRERKDFSEFVWSGTFGNPMRFESRVKRALEGN